MKNPKKALFSIVIASGLLSMATPAFAAETPVDNPAGVSTSETSTVDAPSVDAAKPAKGPKHAKTGVAPLELSIDGPRDVTVAAGQHVRFTDAPTGSTVFVSNPRVLGPHQAGEVGGVSRAAGFAAHGVGSGKVLVLLPSGSVSVFSVTVMSAAGDASVVSQSTEGAPRKEKPSMGKQHGQQGHRVQMNVGVPSQG